MLHLRSATQRKLILPRYRLNGFGRRRFAVAGPSTWNSLPDSLRDPELSLNTFERKLKTYIFCEILTRKRTERISICCINLHFTYLLTCLLEHQDFSQRSGQGGNTVTSREQPALGTGLAQGPVRDGGTSTHRLFPTGSSLPSPYRAPGLGHLPPLPQRRRDGRASGVPVSGP